MPLENACVRAAGRDAWRVSRVVALALSIAVFAAVCPWADAQDTVSLSVTLTDDLGFEWDLYEGGYISDGSDDAYDGGHELYVDGSYFEGFEEVTTELDGYQFVIGPETFGNIEVVRKVFISPDGAFARWI